MKGLIFQSEKGAWLHEIGREAQTRRVINPQPHLVDGQCTWYPLEPRFKNIIPLHYASESHWRKGAVQDWSPFKVGEKRYVKEPWRPYQGVHKEIIEYRGEDQFIVVPRELNAHPELDLNCEWTILHDKGDHWRNPLFMPEWAARTIVEITSVGVGKVCEIRAADALAEGIRSFTKDGHLLKYWPCDPCEGPLRCAWQDLPLDPVLAFSKHWQSIHGTGAPWESTWVFVVGLRTVEAK